ncbi:MAG TPA: type II toxin-antitoxin system HicB family antitoxin [Stellaceae bacterium]|nr:type II toxin-antitoxin system HicB family antitoxin [Stellaceae bacterium]
MGFPAVFYHQRDGVGVVFPDLPGCVTVGRDVKDAVLKAEEALALHLEGMHEDDEAIPAPTMPVDRAEADPEGHVIGRLWIEPRTGRAVRVTITMDEALLAKVDQAAAARGATRSGFLAEGARQLLDA